MSQRNTSTIYICAFGLAALFETVSSGAACAAQLTFDVIVKNEVLGNISLEKKTQSIQTGTRDAITGQFVSTKNDWQNFLGVDHLNWLQVVTQDWNSPIVNDPSLTIKVPYIDPPKFGYLASGWSDEEPWFWDEYTPMAKYNVLPEEFPIPWNPNNQLTAQTQNNGQVLKFSDVPRDNKANQLKFETFLVGDFGNKTYDFLTGFSWSISLNANGTSNITDIKQCATFTKQYADLVEKQFDYKKVDKLPTYLYSSTLSPGKVDNFTKSGLQASQPFVAWTNNFPGVNLPKKPDTILGAFNQFGKMKTVNDDGGPFGSNWGSGIKSAVNSDGSLKLKVTGYNDFNFDGRNDSSGGPCNGGSGGGGCVRNAPHPQAGKYDLAVKLYQDYLPTSPNSVVASASSTSRNARGFAANSVSGDESSLVSDAVYAASLLSDVPPANKGSSINGKNPDDDALPAEAVPEPTTGLGALLALSGLGLLKKLKNRKTKE